MGRWDKIDTWTGEGLRREVFFFPCGGVELYGSLYAATPLRHRLGVVFCNSWGFEADRANNLIHPLALWLAQAGGAGLVFHQPGFGDSHGDPDALTIGAMVDAADCALAEGRRRLPDSDWLLAGFMLGASIASMALARAESEAVLLAQPALRPSEYFADLQRRAKRLAALKPSGEDTAFGYSPAEGLLSSAAEADSAVAAALDAFEGRGAVVRYSSPKGTDRVPERFERVEVEGTWRFGAKDNGELRRAARGWLRRYMRKHG